LQQLAEIESRAALFAGAADAEVVVLAFDRNIRQPAPARRARDHRS